MGTPEIAAGVLEALIASKHEVLAVVTQPDRPKGRGNEIEFSAVKKTAMAHNITVLQPQKASSPESAEAIAQLKPDVITVAAYGQILKDNILQLAPYGCINVHASLLPKYRGASPIQWAVINGEKETGITIMHMDAGIDTGDIILQRTLTLACDETAGSLHDRLTEMGGPALIEALDRLEAGTAERIPQDSSKATYVSMLKKSMGELDFTCGAAALERLIRGLIPWPGAYTFLDGKMLKLWSTCVAEEDFPKKKAVPGSLFSPDRENLYIATGDGCLKILELQLEGKKRMPADVFLRGYSLKEDTICRRAEN